MLYRYLAQSRAGEADAFPELEANANRLTSKEWPYAVIELYLGRRTYEATLDGNTPERRCEAQFYFAEWLALKSGAAEAETELKGIIDSCPQTSRAYKDAVAELTRSRSGAP
jgi:hypothetical protein